MSLLKERNPKIYWETVAFLGNVLIPSSWHKTCKTQLKIKLHAVLKPRFLKEIPSLHWEFSLTQKDSVPEITPRTGPCLLFHDSEWAHVQYVGNHRIPWSLILTEQEEKAADWAGSVLNPMLCLCCHGGLSPHTELEISGKRSGANSNSPVQPIFLLSSNLVLEGLKMALAWEEEGGALPPVQTLT